MYTWHFFIICLLDPLFKKNNIERHFFKGLTYFLILLYIIYDFLTNVLSGNLVTCSGRNQCALWYARVNLFLILGVQGIPFPKKTQTHRVGSKLVFLCIAWCGVFRDVKVCAKWGWVFTRTKRNTSPAFEWIKLDYLWFQLTHTGFIFALSPIFGFFTASASPKSKRVTNVCSRRNHNGVNMKWKCKEVLLNWLSKTPRIIPKRF